MESINIFVGYR
jgi:centrin-2